MYKNPPLISVPSTLPMFSSIEILETIKRVATIKLTANNITIVEWPNEKNNPVNCAGSPLELTFSLSCLLLLDDLDL